MDRMIKINLNSNEVEEAIVDFLRKNNISVPSLVEYMEWEDRGRNTAPEVSVNFLWEEEKEEEPYGAQTEIIHDPQDVCPDCGGRLCPGDSVASRTKCECGEDKKEHDSHPFGSRTNYLSRLRED